MRLRTGRYVCLGNILNRYIWSHSESKKNESATLSLYVNHPANVVIGAAGFVVFNVWKRDQDPFLLNLAEFGYALWNGGHLHKNPEAHELLETDRISNLCDDALY